LDEAVNAEIIDAQEISGLLDGIREPFRAVVGDDSCFGIVSIVILIG